MTIIVDSGSTKATWCMVEKTGTTLQITTEGINPQYERDCMEFCSRTAEALSPILAYGTPEEIFFYGSGCVSQENKNRVSRMLHLLTGCDSISVESDMPGAARAIFGKSSGIAAILGTGSNSCLYDGNEIITSIHAGGYILGDEGSGAVLGRNLISDYIKGLIPAKLKEILEQQYSLSYPTVVEKVYRADYPNRYLAGFTHFISGHRNHPYIKKLLSDSFSAFWERNILGYPEYKRYKIGFIGSVAAVFEAELRLTAQKYDMEIESIDKSPICGLIKYHGLDKE